MGESDASPPTRRCASLRGDLPRKGGGESKAPIRPARMQSVGWNGRRGCGSLKVVAFVHPKRGAVMSRVVLFAVALTL